MTDKPASPDGVDPSMEEILASIRRILNEDEAPADASAAEAEATPDEDDVLVLDRSMLVSAPEGSAAVQEPQTDPLPNQAETMATFPLPDPGSAELPALAELPAPAEPSGAQAVSNPGGSFTGHSLVAPETAAAAASSIDGLMRTLASNRAAQVYRGGPTIEDLVREEIRPLLAHWLDVNLPPLVERLVRAEIERVVGRIVP